MRRAGIIAMTGTRQRNYHHYPKAVEIIRSGRLGKIALVECWNYHNTRNRVGHAEDSEPPPGYHWDLWLGPAPKVPFNKARLDNPRHWGDGKPGNEVDGPWQRLFVDCVKQGNQPPIDFEQSHQATVCCHLANIAYRVGRKIKWNADEESIPNDPQAAKLLSPSRRKGFELPEV